MWRPSVPNHTLPFQIGDFVLLALGIDDWQAFAYEWHSPRRMLDRTHYDAEAMEYALGPVVVCTQVTDAKPLKILAAEYGFWHIAWTPTLEKLAVEEKTDLTKCENELTDWQANIINSPVDLCTILERQLRFLQKERS